jgi:hypothetical protein
MFNLLQRENWSTFFYVGMPLSKVALGKEKAPLGEENGPRGGK